MCTWNSPGVEYPWTSQYGEPRLHLSVLLLWGSPTEGPWTAGAGASSGGTRVDFACPHLVHCCMLARTRISHTMPKRAMGTRLSSASWPAPIHQPRAVSSSIVRGPPRTTDQPAATAAQRHSHPPKASIPRSRTLLSGTACDWRVEIRRRRFLSLTRKHHISDDGMAMREIDREGFQKATRSREHPPAPGGWRRLVLPVAAAHRGFNFESRRCWMSPKFRSVQWVGWSLLAVRAAHVIIRGQTPSESLPKMIFQRLHRWPWGSRRLLI